MRLARFALLLLPACGVVLGLDDLERDACVGDCTSGPDKEANDGGTTIVDGQTTSDDGSPMEDSPSFADVPGKKPSYCNDVSLYLPFDGTMHGHLGQTPNGDPAGSYRAPKYGDASAFVNTQVFTYASSLATTNGTIAMWLRNIGCSPGDRLYTQGTIDGPRIRCDLTTSNRLFLTYVGATSTDVIPPTGTSDGAGWNFVAASWGESAGLAFYLWDPSGALHTSTAPAKPAGGSTTLTLGFPASPTGPNAHYDDLVVWSRVLTQVELDALRQATTSFGVTCAL